MVEINVFRTDVEEIVDGDIRTVSMLLREYDEIVEVSMKKVYMTVDEGIEMLKDKLLSHNGIKVNIIKDAELILKEAHKNGTEVKLLFKDDYTGKLHEVNFEHAPMMSLFDFINSHRSRIESMLRHNLDVEVVKIIF